MDEARTTKLHLQLWLRGLCKNRAPETAREKSDVSTLADSAKLYQPRLCVRRLSYRPPGKGHVHRTQKTWVPLKLGFRGACRVVDLQQYFMVGPSTASAVRFLFSSFILCVPRLGHRSDSLKAPSTRCPPLRLTKVARSRRRNSDLATWPRKFHPDIF